MNGAGLWIDQAKNRCGRCYGYGSGGRDGVVNAVVNAQRDLVLAGAQPALEQQPVFTFRRQSTVEAARPGDHEEFRTGGRFQLSTDPITFHGEGGARSIVVPRTVGGERNQFGTVEGLGRR